MTIFLQKNTRKSWNHLRNILSFHISTFWNSKILTFLDLSTHIFVSYFRNSPPQKCSIPIDFGIVLHGIILDTHYFDKMQNHKQILMKSEICSRSVDHLCLNQECDGILNFLANSPLKFAWIIGIYGKPFFEF